MLKKTSVKNLRVGVSEEFDQEILRHFVLMIGRQEAGVA